MTHLRTGQVAGTAALRSTLSGDRSSTTTRLTLRHTMPLTTPATSEPPTHILHHFRVLYRVKGQKPKQNREMAQDPVVLQTAGGFPSPVIMQVYLLNAM